MRLKPFLKWAGSKYRMLDLLEGHFPITCKRFLDPFTGTGSVVFNVDYPVIIANDFNKDLTNLFLILQEFGPQFIEYAEELFVPANNSEDAFYAFRTEFNACDDPYRRSALFIYLNRHCFNGLCRYNASGLFNVPFGKYASPQYPKDALIACLPKVATLQITNKDFRDILSMAGDGDLVYCDPPYIPISTTANFSSYTATGFSLDDQLDLAKYAQQAAGRGATVVLSNHYTPLSKKIYEELYPSTVHLVDVARTISGTVNNRRAVTEMIAVYLPRR